MHYTVFRKISLRIIKQNTACTMKGLWFIFQPSQNENYCSNIQVYSKWLSGVQLSSGNSAPNSGNSHHLTISFEGGMHRFKRQGACVSRKWRYESEPPLKPPPMTCGTNSIIVSMLYVTKTWSVVLLNKKNTYFYLKCIVYDKLLKLRQSFWITLYNSSVHSSQKNHCFCVMQNFCLMQFRKILVFCLSVMRNA